MTEIFSNNFCNRMQNKIFYLFLFSFTELIKPDHKIPALIPVADILYIYEPELLILCKLKPANYLSEKK